MIGSLPGDLQSRSGRRTIDSASYARRRRRAIDNFHDEVHMFEVVSNEEIAPKLHRMVIRAPRVARARKPGQFVIVRVGEGAERIPLTIADDDAGAGTITLIIQAVGRSARRRSSPSRPEAPCATSPGRSVSPPHIVNFGRVVCVGGGAGTAVLFPLAKALAAAGNEPDHHHRRAQRKVRRAARRARRHLQRAAVHHRGRLARRDRLRHPPLKRILEGGDGDRPQAVYAIGPVPMMKAVANLTRDYGRQDDRLAEPAHGRRHRHVRRLPRHGRRRDQVRLRRRPRVRRPPGRLRRARRPPGQPTTSSTSTAAGWTTHVASSKKELTSGRQALTAKERMQIPRVSTCSSRTPSSAATTSPRSTWGSRPSSPSSRRSAACSARTDPA